MDNPIIRMAVASDAPQIQAIYGPMVEDKNTVVCFEYTAPPITEIAQRITVTLPTHPWLVAEEGNSILGYAYATLHRKRIAYQWTVEPSVYIHSDHWRRGVARGLYTALIDVLALQGYLNAIAVIVSPNPASIHFHTSMGFEHVATFPRIGYKFGKWYDTIWYMKHLPAGRQQPNAPRPTQAITQLDAYQRALQAGAGLIKPGNG